MFNKLVIILLFYCTAQAQLWDGIIDPARAKDWSTAGATIVHRTTVCATISTSDNSAAIDAAIVACPEGQVVYFQAGTYTIDAGITIRNKSNITLRGAGPDKTFLLGGGGYSGCEGVAAVICVGPVFANQYLNPRRTANWTALYDRGATVITLDTTADLVVGALLHLDQDMDDADTGEIWVCGGPQGGELLPSLIRYCCVSCGNKIGRTVDGMYKGQMQTVTVLEINGNNITISDPLEMPQWRADRNPGVWYQDNFVAPTGVGIEDMSIDGESGPSPRVITFLSAVNSWVKNVRAIQNSAGSLEPIMLYQAAHITVRDSYLVGPVEACVKGWYTSNNLIENNIGQYCWSLVTNDVMTGSVMAYNYDNEPEGTNPADSIVYADVWWHQTGGTYNLVEGNLGQQYRPDYFHGIASMNTAFRNRFVGRNPGNVNPGMPIWISMGHRYHNIIGNVLGADGIHTLYQKRATLDDPAGGNCSQTIFVLGWGGLCGTINDGTNGFPPDDSLVESTMVRWGNYDTVNDAVRWEADEMPTADAYYPNAVPADQNLPASFYLANKPSWWESPSGIATPPWPAIGPDVTGGNGPDGFSYDIPSKVCFDNLPLDPFYTEDVREIRLFDADFCYQKRAQSCCR